MSTEAERQYVNEIAPNLTAEAGEGCVTLAATTATASTPIPDSYRERFIELLAVGDAIWVGFSKDGTPVLDKTVTATFAAPSANNGTRIGNGERLRVRVGRAQKYLHWQADAANSKLVVRPASQVH